MNEVLITNWNDRVRDEDTVFHIGDFQFRNSPGGKAGEGLVHKAIHYMKKMNGKIIFINGNHDKNNSVKTIIQNLVIKYGNHFINLVHDPRHYDARYSINFVGHIHEKWTFKRIYDPIAERNIDLINVGVDVWKFRPVTFEELYSGYKRWIKQGCK